MKTDLTIEKHTIPMGAGHYVKRWVLLQDGAIREIFFNYMDAERTLNSLRDDWGSQDE
jgi:hypothetical protein